MAKEQSTNFEAQLFKAADKLRKNIDAADYKNVVLGLVFLKYISDNFNEIYTKLSNHEFTEYDDPEDRDEYDARNVFFVPEKARRNRLQEQAKLPDIGVKLDEAMEAIENENKQLKWVLPKVYGRQNLDSQVLWWLIDLISNADLREQAEQNKDLFGRVYEYFLGEFANAEGKKWGQFYTPKCIVKMMVEMIEPYKWQVFDPACGSGWMFVMSEKFVQEHQWNVQDITIYGQESNETTWKLAKMNLAIRNINSEFVKWNTEWSFLKDAHQDLKADFVLANPPFNQSDRWQEVLQDDARWQYWTPPSWNANFGWMQHMLYHLKPQWWVMATVLANWSLSSTISWEWDIRRNIIEADLVDCILAMPKQLFYNTWIPACVRFLRRWRNKRNWETLFIDASELWFMKDRVHRELSDDDIKLIAETYHNWRKWENYEDVLWFCKSATLQEIEKQDYVLTPGRYVGIKEEEDDWIPFEEKMKNLTSTLSEQMNQEQVLNEEIKTQLWKIGFSL